MNELLVRIIDAHGGIDCWNRFERVEATIVSGGGFFHLKGVPQDPTPRRMTVWLHEERSSVFPFGGSRSTHDVYTREGCDRDRFGGLTRSSSMSQRQKSYGHQLGAKGLTSSK